MTIYFIILFPLIIINSLLVILSKNSVNSVLYLISVFILISLNLIFVGAEFLAILIIIIYIGAISILFLFVIMMLNLRILEVYSSLVNIFPIASFLGLIIFVELYYITIKEYYLIHNNNNYYYELSLFNYNLILSHSNLYLIGDLLYNHYNIMLIIVGLILLVAMLGAIILTKNINHNNKNILLKKKNITF
jgi:NADH:ubiquinone oxidoreductase subunit 6 (subunit J)